MDAPFVYDFKSRYVYDQLLKCVHACVLSCRVWTVICVSVCGVRGVCYAQLHSVTSGVSGLVSFPPRRAAAGRARRACVSEPKTNGGGR